MTGLPSPLQQLPYQPKPRSGEGWWSQAGSNRRPPACHAGALPAELWPQFAGKIIARDNSGRTISSLFFLFDAVTDDIGHVGIAFLLLFDEGGIVECLVGLDFFLVARGSAFSRLLALLF